MDRVVALHGVPSVIISDRDIIFNSNVWEELMRTIGIKLNMLTAYHPQTKKGKPEFRNLS